MKVGVIGSGPSGWAAAWALFDKNIDFVWIDADIQEHSAVLNQNPSNSSRKLLHGSDLPYREFEFGPSITQNNTDVGFSFMSGGLSNTWGATMSPYTDLDLCGWPIKFPDLDKYYRYISGKLPIAGNLSKLDSQSRDFTNSRLETSERITLFIEKFNSLNLARYTIQQSSLAIQTKTESAPGCYYCNQCISGCPDDYIWSSKQGRPHIEQNICMRVIKIEMNDGLYDIIGVDNQGLIHTISSFERIFLAAGPIESFRILASSNLIAQEAELLDSRTFYFPIFSFFRDKKYSENTIGLSQAFVKHGGTDNEPGFMMQFYDYSASTLEIVVKKLPYGKLWPRWLIEPLLRKCFLGVGYLPSALSTRIRMRLDLNGNLFLDQSNSSPDNRQVNKSIRKSMRSVSRYFYKIGLLVFPRGYIDAGAGGGVHHGGWLRMGVNSDRIGQPTGVKNIHLVDSSTFPSVPAGPITFSIMANAARIVDEVYP